MQSKDQQHLARKLGLKEGLSVYTNKPVSEYRKLVGSVDIDFLQTPFMVESIDFCHLFIQTFDDLVNEFQLIYPAIVKTGAVWISWQKGEMTKKTGINRDLIREFVLESDMVDTKVCSVDEKWSALKFMYRKSKR